MSANKSLQLDGLRSPLLAKPLDRVAMLSELEKRLIEHELLMLSDSELVRWAVAVLESNAPASTDPDIVNLASLPTSPPRLCESAGSLLRVAVQRAHPRFDPSSHEAEAYARKSFVQFCSRLVAEEIRPYEFCRVISPIEQLFEFPLWLGEFFNHCDWCEPESSRSDFSHLIEYAAQYVREHAG